MPVRQAFGHAYGMGCSQAHSPYLQHRPKLVGGVAPKPPFFLTTLLSFSFIIYIMFGLLILILTFMPQLAYSISITYYSIFNCKLQSLFYINHRLLLVQLYIHFYRYYITSCIYKLFINPSLFIVFYIAIYL